MGSLRALTNRYLRERVARGELTRASTKAPRHALNTLSASFGRRPLSQFGPAAVERWLETTTHLAPATRRNMLGAVRLFCRWLVRKGHIRRDPTVDIGRIRQPRTVVHIVTTDERRALWDACATLRDRAMFVLLYGLGLRCIEVSRLNVEDWDRTAGIILVVGKGGHERVLPVLELHAAVLAQWIATDPRSTGPLFPSPHGGPIRAATISDRFAHLMRKAGVKHHAFDGKGAHALRRTAATETLSASGDLRATKDLLGHADWGSMKHYQARANANEIAAALRMRFAIDPPEAA